MHPNIAKKIRDLRQLGYTSRAVAKELGITTVDVARAMKATRLGPKKDPKTEAVKDLIAEGHSPAAIRAVFGADAI